MTPMAQIKRFTTEDTEDTEKKVSLFALRAKRTPIFFSVSSVVKKSYLRESASSADELL
jgi:hypothetical protein